MTKIYSMKNKHPERQPQKAISSGCSFQRYFSSSLPLVIHKRLVLTPASYHLVVVTKYRHPVINGAFKDRLTELTYRIFEENFQCYVNEVNTDKDHIHILFEAPPQVALSSLVCSYKTVTARLLRKEFAEYLAPFYWKPYLWNRSYFVCTVSERSHELITEYIRNQRNKEKG